MVHRRRRRYRYRRAPAGRFAASAVAAGIGLAALAGHLPSGGAVPTAGTPGRAAAAAIAYARAQLGRPYLWGGTGPDAFDCSGLVMMAWRSAGIAIARTSQAQWATEPKVPAYQVEPGDLVFFAGSDGTAADPGHVGLVVDPARHLMIEAYAAGFPVRYSSFGLPGSPAGDQVPAGFTRPGRP